MKVYYCGACGSLVFFENVKCLTCGRALGFVPSLQEMVPLENAGNGALKTAPPSAGKGTYRWCLNAQNHAVCNWLVPMEESNPLCASCRLNQVIPNLEVPGNLERWREIETAKHRVIYTLLRLGLPMEGSGENGAALRFSFLGDVPGQLPIRTGHDKGLITLNIAEADDADRERRRISLHEPYRTLAGHFRHEVGHYYWDRLIANTSWVEPWRARFGDETQSYEEALKTYYEKGPPADWQLQYVSAYAGAHPWEDWAETWAHYFHIVDTLETAAGFGVTLKPDHPSAKSMSVDARAASCADGNFDNILNQWFPLVCVLNSLNRGMGLRDLYPFALSNAAIEKLRFVDEVVRGNGVIAR
jgi:hypothetical protein